jgi:hypothetical protein
LGGFNSVQEKRGDAGRFRTQDLHDAAAGQATYADNAVKFCKPDRNNLNVRGCRGAQPLDRAVAKLLLDPGDRSSNVTLTLELIIKSSLRDHNADIIELEFQSGTPLR